MTDTHYSISDNDNLNTVVLNHEQKFNNHIALLRSTVSFVRELCTHLKLQLLAQSTALVYLHRFVHVQGLNEHDRYVLGCACVFLASKVEEDSRKLDHVADAAQRIRDFRGNTNNSDKNRLSVSRAGVPSVNPSTSTSGTNTAISMDNRGVLDSGSKSTVNTGDINTLDSHTNSQDINAITQKEDSKECHQSSLLREKILLFERVLLHSLSFDVAVVHPHILVVKFLNKLRPSNQANAQAEYRHVAWHYLNDALSTDLCVRFQPSDIAAAAILMAHFEIKEREDNQGHTKQLIIAVERELSEHRLGLFRMTEGKLETIFSAVYDVYERPPPYINLESLKEQAQSEAVRAKERELKRNSLAVKGNLGNLTHENGRIEASSDTKKSSDDLSSQSSNKKMKT